MLLFITILLTFFAFIGVWAFANFMVNELPKLLTSERPQAEHPRHWGHRFLREGILSRWEWETINRRFGDLDRDVDRVWGVRLWAQEQLNLDRRKLFDERARFLN